LCETFLVFAFLTLEFIKTSCVNTIMSFLALEGFHVFVTGAAGGIGSAIVDEFLGMVDDGERDLHSYA
jgi:hypothetical protein